MTFKKFEKIVNICLLIFVSIAILWFSADIFTAKKVDFDNITKIETEFIKLEKYRIEGKISYSYNLYVGQDSVYKIIADNVDCFKVDSFMQNTNAGDLIEIYINKDNGLKFPDLKSVFGLVKNRTNYIYLDCVNEKVDSNKKLIPMMFGFFALVIILSILYTKSKNKGKTNA
ncbi:hypothetical protein [Flavobacterium silvaticum]|uniref:Uncharacterized protein n=1 Tax=Flavobacterium silvaticum TaxID=1852020 RepID=A0A972JG60_9FLAO|nr:hypothetical protein [Flavobacterium silvaticum]NMH26520.1 hypothetical protein [Flavobacterium silvaticum]